MQRPEMCINGIVKGLTVSMFHGLSIVYLKPNNQLPYFVKKTVALTTNIEYGENCVRQRYCCIKHFRFIVVFLISLFKPYQSVSF